MQSVFLRCAKRGGDGAPPSGLLGAVAVFGAFVAFAPACQKDQTTVGLMLAMTTELDTPGAVDEVGISVEVNGVVVANPSLPVSTDGSYKVFFPATLAVLPPPDGSARVRVRSAAFKNGIPLVVRSAIVDVPNDALRLLRLPLTWADRMPANTVQTATPPLSVDRIVDGCAYEETRLNGACTSAVVNAGALPICGQVDCLDQLRKRVTSQGNTLCYTASTCFPASCAAPVTTGLVSPSAPLQSGSLFEREGTSCRFHYRGPAASASQINFALTLPDGSLGQCADRVNRTGCFATITRDASNLDGEGWGLDGADLATGAIVLPPWVCAHASDPGTALVASFGCGPIYSDMVTCGETAGGDTVPVAFDSTKCIGGSTGDAGVPRDAGDASTTSDANASDASDGG